MPRSLMSLMLVLLGIQIIMFPAFSSGYNSNTNPSMDLMREELYNGSFTLNENTDINKTVKLNFSLETAVDAPNTKVKIILPNEVKLIRGDEIWSGDLQKGEKLNFTYLISPVEEGEFLLSVKVENENFKGFDRYFVKNINITREKAFLYSGEESLPERQKTKQLLQKPSEEVLDNQNISAGTATIYGYLSYEDVEGIQHPVRYASTELWQDNPILPDTLLATSNTDQNGRFSFSIYISSNINVFVKVKCDTEAAMGTTDSGSFYYAPIPNDGSVAVSEGSNYLGSWYVGNTYQNWQAYDYVINAYQWLDNSAGYKRSKIYIRWPSAETCGTNPPEPWPCSDGNVIYLPQQSSWPWDKTTVYHEYAHCIMYSIYGSFPGGCSFPEHFVNTESCEGIALTEGWAEFFQCAVDNSPTNLVDKTCNKITNIEDNNWHLGRSTCSAVNSGSIIEGAVASIWWDIFDSSNAPQDPDSDSLSLGLSQIFYIIKNYKPVSINGFWDKWMATYGYRSQLNSIYLSHGINKNTVPNTPSIPSGPASGVSGTAYSYSASATDPDGDQVKYTFNWGDGTTSQTGLINSGTAASVSHTWSSAGTYLVKAMATDSLGATSGWSNTLTVSIATSGTTDKIGVFRNKIWYLDYNCNGYWDSGDTTRWFGEIGDKPVAGDWNNNGRDEIGVVRNGIWYLDYNGNGNWDSYNDATRWFGEIGDTPIVGDWNKDGRDEIGVVRNRVWYLDYNGNGYWDSGDTTRWFGEIGDTPVIGDWNKDGRDEIGVVRNRVWYLDYNGNGYWDSGDATRWFGEIGDKPVAGDWNADGRDEIGVVRNRVWYLDYNGNGYWDSGDATRWFGEIGDKPVVGYW